MLLSCSLVKNCLDNHTKVTQESYDDSDPNKMTPATALAMLVVALVILVIEIAILFFALKLAIETTTSTGMRILHIFLALFFTIPYILFSVLLSPKACDVLHMTGEGLKGNVSSSFRMHKPGHAARMRMHSPKAKFRMGCGAGKYM